MHEIPWATEQEAHERFVSETQPLPWSPFDFTREQAEEISSHPEEYALRKVNAARAYLAAHEARADRDALLAEAHALAVGRGITFQEALAQLTTRKG